MKKLLAITTAYPPHAGAGASRSTQLMKYLPGGGWLPRVVCSDWTQQNCPQFDAAFGGTASRELVAARVPPPADLTRVETSTDAVLKAMRFFDGYRNPRDWVSSALAACRRVAHDEEIDAVWATFPFRGALFVASKVAKELQVPWVADFRDIFEQGVPTWRWKWEAMHERRVVANASLITTVSEGLADRLRTRHSAPVRCLPNGFDLREWEDVQPIRSEKFTILYSGSVRPVGSRRCSSPRPVFQALDLLAERSEIDLKQVELQFVGASPQQLAPHFDGCYSSRVVRCDEWSPRGRVYARQKGADVLLLLTSAEMRGIMTSKVFEYIAAGRRILAVPSDGDCVDALLRKSRAGESASSVEEIAALLRRWFSEWSALGSLEVKADREAIAQYDRQVQGKQLAEWLNALL